MTDLGVAPSARGMEAPDTLTAEQRAIVDWEDGPLVVVAGAGTGKTRVIVERVRRLLETKGGPAGTGGLTLPAEAATADREPAPRPGRTIDSCLGSAR